MKVKIFGEITNEQLIKALEEAKSFYVDEEGLQTAVFFGAYLYLQAYDVNGERLNWKDENGNQAQTCIQSLPGQPNAPSLRRENIDKPKRKKQEIELAKEKNEAARIREERERERNQAYVAHYDRITKQLIDNDPIGAMEIFNVIVDRTWQDMHPTYIAGKNKGMLRKKPIFFLQQPNNELRIKSDIDANSSVVITNPVCKVNILPCRIEMHWKYDAWERVASKIGGFLLEYEDIEDVTAND